MTKEEVKFLFLGGPGDGQRLPIDGEQNVVIVPEIPPLEITRFFAELTKEPCSILNKHEYFRVDFYDELDRTFSVYTHRSRWPVALIFERLIAAYPG